MMIRHQIGGFVVALLLAALLGCEGSLSNRLEQGDTFYDERHGQWTFYYSEEESPNRRQVKAQGYYDFGQRDGTWNYYYPTGELRETGDFFADEREGYWVTYDQHGFLLAEGEYNAGQKTGQWYYYHPSTAEDRAAGEERVQAVGEYLRGHRHGDWVRFDALGNTSVTAQFNLGERTGSWVRYVAPDQPPIRIDYDSISPRFRQER